MGKGFRAPDLDGRCARCVRDFLQTVTMAYRCSLPSGKMITVHWCPRHQAEVAPAAS